MCHTSDDVLLAKGPSVPSLSSLRTCATLIHSSCSTIASHVPAARRNMWTCRKCGEVIKDQSHPFWNCGAMVVLVQRAYFSACRMVFDVPSGMSAGMRALP